jgi:hypothetical protein
MFDAATLAVYRVFDSNPAQAIRDRIDGMIEDDPAIRRDFQVVEVGTPVIVRISLPRAVHLADHDAWKHVDSLRGSLCCNWFDCHWAHAPFDVEDRDARDRSRHVTYTIVLVTPDDKPSTRHWASDDQNLENEGYRLRIINSALEGSGTTARSYALIDSDKSGWRKAQGRITLDSRDAVVALVEDGAIEVIKMGSSEYNVQFHYRHGSITPTACTTIGLNLKGLRSDQKDDIVDDLKEHLSQYNLANNCEGTIRNIRMSEENPDYLLCDPCNIMVAQGLCAVPIGHAKDRFFRQIYFANASPANYIKKYEISYQKRALLEYQAREERDFFDEEDTPSGTFEPLLLEIAPHKYPAPEKPSELQNLRHSQLTKVQNWRNDQGKNKELDPRRMVASLYRTNVRIAEITKAESEHDTGVVVLYRHDVEALETQISIHQAIGLLNADHKWAVDRLEHVSRVLKRLELSGQLENAKNRMLHGGNVEVPARRRKADEEAAEYDRLVEESKAEASIEYQRLIIEISVSIANDRLYLPPLSASSTSPTMSSPEPTTPLNNFQTSNLDTAVTLPGLANMIERIPLVSPPPSLAQKRKHEEMSDPSPHLYYTPNIQVGIRKRETAIHAKKTSLRAFASAPSGSECKPRDNIQKEVDDLQTELSLYKSTYGTSLPPRQSVVSPPVWKESDFGVGFRSRR